MAVTDKLIPFIERNGDCVVISHKKHTQQEMAELRAYLKAHQIPYMRVGDIAYNALTGNGGRSILVSKDAACNDGYVRQLAIPFQPYGKSELQAQIARKQESLQRHKEKSKVIVKRDGFVYYRGKCPTWEQTTRNELNNKSTTSESDVYRWMSKRFSRGQVVRQYPIRIGTRLFYLDLFVKVGNVAIEVDGGYHFTPEQQAADAERTRLLSSAGIKVLRITNEDVKDRHKLRCFVTEVRMAVEKYKQLKREMKNSK